jgi:hypothetical protein
MRIVEIAGLVVCAAGCIALFATTGPESDIELIDRLDTIVLHRFADPMPANLGMSRIAGPPSFGEHYSPNWTSLRDFQPERSIEQEAIAALEARHTQVGFYLYGRAIAESAPADLNFRALKGPAVMTRGTPRPAWYPSLPMRTDLIPNGNANTLPDWNAIYPLARKAMQSFEDGGHGFETELGNWNIAARPVIATQERCVTCHNNPAYRPSHVTKLNETIGGVLYAYRRS